MNQEKGKLQLSNKKNDPSIYGNEYATIFVAVEDENSRFYISEWK